MKYNNYNEENMPAQLSQMIVRYNIMGTPIEKGDTVLFLGEIPNMKGHIAFVDRDGKIWWGYHPDIFRQPVEGEVSVTIEINEEDFKKVKK